jgi:hypothetical protein
VRRENFEMRTIVLRVLAGLLGLFAVAIAIVEPPLFIFNELQEARSAHQYGGHASLLGAVVVSVILLLVAGLLVFTGFALLRFSIRGSKRPVILPVGS